MHPIHSVVTNSENWRANGPPSLTQYKCSTQKDTDRHALKTNINVFERFASLLLHSSKNSDISSIKKIKTNRKQSCSELVGWNPCWLSKKGKNQEWQSLCSPLQSILISPNLPSCVPLSLLSCRWAGYSAERGVTMCPLVGDIAAVFLWINRGAGFRWGGALGGGSSGQRPFSRWRRGLQPRGAGPDPQSHWAVERGRGDSGCGTLALSSPGSLSPVSACIPAVDKKKTINWLQSTELNYLNYSYGIFCVTIEGSKR